MADQQVGDDSANRLRRTGRNRGPELPGAAEPCGGHGDRDARALGDVLVAIARITKRLSPAVSEAYAVPIAKPSGRL